MKRKNERNRHLFGILTLCLLMPLATSVFAYEDADEDFLQSDQLDIDGDYNRRKDLDKQRRKLETQTNDLIDKKIEGIRVKHEKNMRKDLKGLFQKVGSDQAPAAAPAPRLAAPQVIIEKAPEVKRERKVLVTPFVGGSKIMTDEYDFDLESKVVGGLKVEFLVHPRVSIGVGLRHTQLQISDINTTSGWNTYDYYGFYYGSTVSNYGANTIYRDVKVRQTSLEINSRVFMMENSQIRPYVGLGLGVTRNSLEYDEDKNINQPYYYDNVYYNNNDADYNSTTMTGSVSIGADFFVNELFGVNLDLSYFKGFGSSGGSDNDSYYDGYYDNDQYILEEIGQDLESANQYSATLGIVLAF